MWPAHQICKVCKSGKSFMIHIFIKQGLYNHSPSVPAWHILWRPVLSFKRDQILWLKHQVTNCMLR